mmetsp:Transcript_3701/g.7012  ORF Transcript_3701/g.7012 Transcript_3701/m.7012 type:complete len:306 (-) Transcript_3701:453-1370(-)
MPFVSDGSCVSLARRNRTDLLGVERGDRRGEQLVVFALRSQLALLAVAPRDHKRRLICLKSGDMCNNLYFVCRVMVWRRRGKGHVAADVTLLLCVRQLKRFGAFLHHLLHRLLPPQLPQRLVLELDQGLLNAGVDRDSQFPRFGQPGGAQEQGLAGHVGVHIFEDDEAVLGQHTPPCQPLLLTDSHRTYLQAAFHQFLQVESPQITAFSHLHVIGALVGLLHSAQVELEAGAAAVLRHSETQREQVRHASSCCKPDVRRGATRNLFYRGCVEFACDDVLLVPDGHVPVRLNDDDAMFCASIRTNH